MPERTKNVSQHAREVRKCISTYVDQTYPMSARTQNVSNICWPNPSSEHTKCISTYVDQTSLMLAWTLNASQHVLNKPRPCQPKHKMYLNLCWSVPSHAYKEIKCKSTYVDQTYPMQERTQYVSQLVLTKHLPCQWGHKMFLNLCWPNPSHAARTQNLFQHVLTKPQPCQRGH